MERSSAFDPLATIPTAQLARPTGLEPINLRALTPLNRALLVIDGTVTKFLEAYTLEPVEIHRLDHREECLPSEDEWLHAESGTEVALREVFIDGRYSGKVYVHALSTVVLGRVPDELGVRLRRQGEGVGRLLNSYELETRREILWFGKERLAELPEPLRDRVDGEFITRTYRIFRRDLPIALIKESFPISADRLPAHH